MVVIMMVIATSPISADPVVMEYWQPGEQLDPNSTYSPYVVVANNTPVANLTVDFIYSFDRTSNNSFPMLFEGNVTGGYHFQFDLPKYQRGDFFYFQYSISDGNSTTFLPAEWSFVSWGDSYPPILIDPFRPAIFEIFNNTEDEVPPEIMGRIIELIDGSLILLIFATIFMGMRQAKKNKHRTEEDIHEDDLNTRKKRQVDRLRGSASGRLLDNLK